MVLAGKLLHQVVLAWRATDVKPPRPKRDSSVRAENPHPLAQRGVVSHMDEPLPQTGQWNAIVTRDESKQYAPSSRVTALSARRRGCVLGLVTCHCGAYMLSAAVPMASQRISVRPAFEVLRQAAWGMPAIACVTLSTARVVDWIIALYIQRDRRRRRTWADVVETGNAGLAATPTARGCSLSVAATIQDGLEAGASTYPARLPLTE